MNECKLNLQPVKTQRVIKAAGGLLVDSGAEVTFRLFSRQHEFTGSLQNDSFKPVPVFSQTNTTT